MEHSTSPPTFTDSFGSNGPESTENSGPQEQVQYPPSQQNGSMPEDYREMSVRKNSTASIDDDNFRIATLNMPSGIFMMNHEGHVIFMNPAACRLTGWTIEEMKGMTFHQAVHSRYPDGRPYPIEECPVYMNQVNNVAVQNAPEVFIHKSGEFVPITYSVAPLRGGYGVGAVVEFRDCRKEKKAEEERLQAVLVAEKAAAAMDHEALLRKQMTEFIDFVCHEVRNPLHGISANIAFLAETLERLESVYLPTSIPAIPSTPGILSPKSPLSPRNEGSSSPPRAFPPSPPTGLVNNGQSTSEIADLFQQFHNHLRNVRECADHQQAIINNVLDLSRIEAGKVSMSNETFSPHAAVTTAIQMIEAKAAERGVKVSLELENPEMKDLLINGDIVTLRQIYLNFGSNATKFVKDGGKIVVRMGATIDEERNKVTLRGSVEDDGIGMTQEEMAHLFQRFSQANRNVAEKYSGSGLGLSITKELVRLLSGSIDVKSEKGVGSEFSFSAEYDLPSVEEKAAWHEKHDPKPKLKPPLIQKRTGGIQPEGANGMEAESSTSRTRRFQHILAVEDNKINRAIIKKYLRNIDKVQLANDGQQAYDYVVSKAGQDLDLIVMDLEMPNVDGRQSARMIRAWEEERDSGKGAYELEEKEGSASSTKTGSAKRKRKKSKRMVICALSGNARQEQVAEAMASGMDDYLTKPCTAAALEGMIAKWEAIAEAEDLPESRVGTPGG